MELPRKFRKGDMIQAMEGNGAVAPGTVGKVLSAVNDPNLPRMVHVEWSIAGRPQAKTAMKKTWTYTNHVEPLRNDG